MQRRIKEPTSLSEFEVHAFIYSRLRELGINARGEVKVPFKNDSNRRATCRFDIAIFDGGYLTGIVEIKAAPRIHKTDAGWFGTRQGSRYTSFGVPVRIIYGMKQASIFIAQTTASGRIVWGAVGIGTETER